MTRGAHPEAFLEQTIERDGIIRRGDRVLVACSGGPDSVALAALLHAVAKPMELSLALAYVHHNTRESAWQDECVALRLGATLDVPVRTIALEAGIAGEAALRDRRYAVLAAVAAELSMNVIATAHHAEDQSETVLMALFRGAGPDGLAGMRPRRPLCDGLDIARPLLRVGSEDLRYYCHVHALAYAVDPSNADEELRRNALRRALATLRPAFAGLDEAIARAAELLRDELAGAGRADLRRQVRVAVGEGEVLRDVDFEHVEAAVRTLERGGSGVFHMKPGTELRIEGGRLNVMRKDS